MNNNIELQPTNLHALSPSVSYSAHSLVLVMLPVRAVGAPEPERLPCDGTDGAHGRGGAFGKVRGVCERRDREVQQVLEKRVRRGGRGRTTDLGLVEVFLAHDEPEVAICRARQGVWGQRGSRRVTFDEVELHDEPAHVSNSKARARWRECAPRGCRLEWHEADVERLSVVRVRRVAGAGEVRVCVRDLEVEYAGRLVPDCICMGCA